MEEIINIFMKIYHDLRLAFVFLLAYKSFSTKIQNISSKESKKFLIKRFYPTQLKNTFEKSRR